MRDTPKLMLRRLCSAMDAGESMTFVPFWRHTPHKSGRITESCLSQWWLGDFIVDGVTYCCMEQYMMASKARLFGDEATLSLIMAACDPAQIKALGREVKHFVPEVWDEAKYDIVRSGNIHKFSQQPALLEYLLSTGDAVLVEASPYDGIWGVRLPMDAPQVQDPRLWQGENLLGFALMQVREALRRGCPAQA